MHSKIYIYILLSILLAACSGFPRFTSKEEIHSIHEESSSSTRYAKNNDKSIDSNNTEEFTSYNNYSVVETIEGLASYYGEKFHGKPTASGEIFNMFELTAAHKTLPLGTIAKVTNLSNNKSIIVKINDRGPVPEDRIIDLSYGAAKLIDMIKEGVTKVKIDILSLGES